MCRKNMLACASPDSDPWAAGGMEGVLAAGLAMAPEGEDVKISERALENLLVFLGQLPPLMTVRTPAHDDT